MSFQTIAYRLLEAIALAALRAGLARLSDFLTDKKEVDRVARGE